MKTHNNTPTQPPPKVSPDILNNPERRIRLPEVEALTGYSRSSIYAKMADGTFPKAHKMGGRAVAWRFGDILDFINSPPLAEPTSSTQLQHTLAACKKMKALPQRREAK